MFKCLKKFFKKSQPERVVFNDDEIIRYLGDEVIERINWDEITEISVATTDEGPWREDAFILLCNPKTDRGVVVPNGAEGAGDLVGKICDFPGFDEKTFIEAMGCTSNNRFVCWVKKE